MKLSTSLVILASITGTTAKCYSSGQTWIDDCNKNSIKGAIRDLCNSGTLSGWFNSHGTTKTACASSRCNGIRGDFSVAWMGGGGGHTLAASDCIYRLTNEVDGCDRGGESTISDWYFKSDPNSGWC